MVGGALNGTVDNAGVIEQVRPVRTGGFDQVSFSVAMKQQQVQMINAELGAVALAEVDQLFKRLKATVYHGSNQRHDAPRRCVGRNFRALNA